VALPAGKFDSGSWGAVRGASDGQRTLTLILGKAMMLARDTEITDPGHPLPTLSQLPAAAADGPAVTAGRRRHRSRGV
jgi:hypothetical protein